LVVIEETSKRDTTGSVVWKCQCDCGNIAEVSTTRLRHKNKPTKSCGCLNKEQIAEVGRNNLKNLSGQRFGKLTVLQRVENYQGINYTATQWLCKCDCGNEILVMGNNLRNGRTQSCGCGKSRGEEKIIELLTKNKISFEKEKIFQDANTPRGGKYRFDFYINNKYVVEYDGKQHFEDFSWGKYKFSAEEAKKIDQEKNEYCFTHNIPIIRIPYTHLENLILSDLLLETSNFVLKK
jgi:hypothetical protein